MFSCFSPVHPWSDVRPHKTTRAGHGCQQGKPPQGSHRVLEYLGRYVHKTALSNRAIVECNDRAVTFRYRDSKDQRLRTMTLPAGEFLRRFLKHVQPRGFHRVRAYGLLHSSQRVTLRRLQLLLQPRIPVDSAQDQERERRRPRCPACKSERLRIVQCIAATGRRPTAVKLGELPQIARVPPPLKALFS